MAFGSEAIFAAFTGTSGTGLPDPGEYGFGAADASGVSARPTNNATTRPAANLAVRLLNMDFLAGGEPASTGDLTQHSETEVDRMDGRRPDSWGSTRMHARRVEK
ncbi:hypothetical protein [Actinoplanes regularis]|uniref:hypothetical protein n=1 Tax=Actinoplanes regularis TaxID=52697 RepID=UPI0015C5B664|nr:hypothetical protein [Actinoplanes regularis]